MRIRRRTNDKDESLNKVEGWRKRWVTWHWINFFLLLRKPGTHIPQHRRAQVAGSLMSTSRDLLRRCAKEQTWCESSLLFFFYIIFCIFVSSPCIRSVSEKTNGENPKVTSTHPWNLKRCRWWWWWWWWWFEHSCKYNGKLHLNPI